MVLLEPDVAEAFSDGVSANQALRSYLRKSQSKLSRRCSRQAGRRADKGGSAQSRLAAERQSLYRQRKGRSMSSGPAGGGMSNES